MHIRMPETDLKKTMKLFREHNCRTCRLDNCTCFHTLTCSSGAFLTGGPRTSEREICLRAHAIWVVVQQVAIVPTIAEEY